MPIAPSEQLRFWAHELGGMAKTGLLHVDNTYDRDRYDRMLGIAEAMAALTIDADFTPDRPYLPDIGIPTPKPGSTWAASGTGGPAFVIYRTDKLSRPLPGGSTELGPQPSQPPPRRLHRRTA